MGRALNSYMLVARNTCARFTRYKYFSSNYSTSSIKNKMPTLYGDEISPPVRFALMTASHLGIKLDFHKVDLINLENKSDSYTKINPVQKVPALDTGKEVICDSHAIALYLCRQAVGNELYPEDTVQRARVEELLFLNACELFPLDSVLLTDHFSGKAIDDSKVEQWNKKLDILDAKLKSQSWLAGDKMTLGDFCLATTISSMAAMLPLTDRHARIAEWLKRLEKVPCFEINTRGIAKMSSLMK